MSMPKLATLLLGLCLSLPVLALDLNGAMYALPDAKADGLLGEKPDGYLGVVSNADGADEIARLINAARRAEYQKIATQNQLKLADVEKLAGQKAMDKTPQGQFVQSGGQWVRK
jgi:uncharacterized protein YdbL (DUF1318 family)